jgi:WD40 repeat protein
LNVKELQFNLNVTRIHNICKFAAIAWAPHCHELLATGDGAADRCINFWNSFTGESVQCVNTGSQVCNLAWSKYLSEMVSFLHNKIVLSFVVEMAFFAKVRILFYVWNSWCRT